jgi:hypothetical protein
MTTSRPHWPRHERWTDLVACLAVRFLRAGEPVRFVHPREGRRASIGHGLAPVAGRGPAQDITPAALLTWPQMTGSGM